jgi:D-alanine-D-alanine ligase-like ATP-grasp enzyme
LAEELGLEILVEPIYGYAAQITLPSGERRYSRGTVFDINGAGATEIANDKDWTSFFLSTLGYPVPLGAAFFTDQYARELDSDRTPAAAWEYAVSLGLPVYVKPNSKSQGEGVALVFDRGGFDRAVAEACREDKVFLVQSPIAGGDFRLVVLDGAVISAYERLPLSLRGDGSSTIRELLRIKEDTFRAAGRAVKVRADDARIAAMLARLHLDLDSVLVSGRNVSVLPSANLSTGGDAVDLTAVIHPEWSRLAAAIAFDMNLRLVGIDVLSEGPLTDRPTTYTVIEVNAAPGLDNYAAIGPEQKARVRDLYRRVLLALTQGPQGSLSP